ncbi:hypothetical protein NQ317_009049 [Molorchus minor]|uniref:Uncharacterized protein n=1 Tax=Molorchus minor TaxID=1323400 RepID=A0ABQ9ISY9_9CUCU|nr:hypothetical protein NQ317_009049 [Molorchus minor]
MLNRSEIFGDNVTYFNNFYMTNNLTYDNWSLDKGYAEGAGVDAYPRRALLAVMLFITPGGPYLQRPHPEFHYFQRNKTSLVEISFKYKFNVIVISYYLSRLILAFKSTRFITSQRHELYGPTDFLANFGGLLGLFTGFSILSLMEAIYFLTVRICCNRRLYGYWAGRDR